MNSSILDMTSSTRADRHGSGCIIISSPSLSSDDIKSLVTTLSHFSLVSREYRFKPESILLIGLIPGPKEPPLTINQFLAPLVDELLEFFDGVKLNVHAKGEKIVRCALLCVACDIPACRKVSGFLGHKALLGCSKCLKTFPGTFEKRDYSGFDRSNWPPRTIEQHRKNVEAICKCKQITKRNALISEHGCRYSALLDCHILIQFKCQ